VDLAGAWNPVDAVSYTVLVELDLFGTADAISVVRDLSAEKHDARHHRASRSEWAWLRYDLIGHTWRGFLMNPTRPIGPRTSAVRKSR
jgi:hypothetical protein